MKKKAQIVVDYLLMTLGIGMLMLSLSAKPVSALPCNSSGCSLHGCGNGT